jgi:4-hydroxy-tetrahydrodipicolinate synthase
MKTPFPDWTPQGVIPAALLPFREDLTIDFAALRRHLRALAEVPGVSALTVNGHSSEITACTFDEQRAVLDAALAEVGDRLPVICGVTADGGIEAARIARMAQAAGAAALLVFPPQTMSMGGQLRPQIALTHFRLIAEASQLPLIAFQYAVGSGLSYPFETLLALLETVPAIRAIKDWSEPILHERNIRVLQGLPRPVNVLSTNSAWLMSSLVMGCNGLLSGAGSVTAALQVELFDAVRRNDLAAARAVNDRLYPLQQVFYAPPFLDMHNRMKEALVLLGQFGSAAVRPPLCKLEDSEIVLIRRALIESGLLSVDPVSV